MLLVAGSIQHSGHKIIVIFEWHGEVMRSRPEARSSDNGRGKGGAGHGVC